MSSGKFQHVGPETIPNGMSLMLPREEVYRISFCITESSMKQLSNNDIGNVKLAQSYVESIAIQHRYKN